jgi:hypothetical protein
MMKGKLAGWLDRLRSRKGDPYGEWVILLRTRIERGSVTEHHMRMGRYTGRRSGATAYVEAQVAHLTLKAKVPVAANYKIMTVAEFENEMPDFPADAPELPCGD